MNYFFLFLIKIYRLYFSQFISSSCKFYPSCSVYFFNVISKYGFIISFIIFFKRFFKCIFFLKGGFDPSD